MRKSKASMTNEYIALVSDDNSLYCIWTKSSFRDYDSSSCTWQN